MTTQREEVRRLLQELLDAAEFDLAAAPTGCAIAGEDRTDTLPDPLPAILRRPGVRHFLSRAAAELLPEAERVHCGVDLLDVRPLLEPNQSSPWRARQSFAACIREMLDRNERGFSARPPNAEHLFGPKNPFAIAGQNHGADATLQDAATWTLRTAAVGDPKPTPQAGAPPRPAAVDAKPADAQSIAGEDLIGSGEARRAFDVPSSTLQGWTSAGLKFAGSEQKTKLEIRDTTASGERRFRRADVARFAEQSRQWKEAKGKTEPPIC